VQASLRHDGSRLAAGRPIGSAELRAGQEQREGKAL